MSKIGSAAANLANHLNINSKFEDKVLDSFPVQTPEQQESNPEQTYIMDSDGPGF